MNYISRAKKTWHRVCVTLSQSSDFLSAVCVSKSRDKVQPLTRVPVRTTRNAKERWWSDMRDVDLSPLTIIPCLGLDIHG